MVSEHAVETYGVLEQTRVQTDLDQAVEEIAQLGYTVVASGYRPSEISAIAEAFTSVHSEYVERHGASFLAAIDELNGMRLPLALSDRILALAVNRTVLKIVKRSMRAEFVLNQQNGIINPSGQQYNQGRWHRDLPYQHFTSSRPLAVNALYCVDDFSEKNGATLVLPGSHVHEAFPSSSIVRRLATSISAPAGSFIVMNAMLFHSGGANTTPRQRRAVNHLYAAPFIKQQIDIPSVLAGRPLSKTLRDLLGFRYQLPRSVGEYLHIREQRQSAPGRVKRDR
jgi:ectoine hydroxylase-related dioxygenase (phytanoyl-CoA dioxygenase family)